MVSGEVLRPFLTVDLQRVVQDRSGVPDETLFHGRSIDAQRLDGGTRGTDRIRCTVQTAVDGLRTGAADHGNNVSLIVHDGDGRLDLLLRIVLARFGPARFRGEGTAIDVDIFRSRLDVRVLAGIDAETAAVHSSRRFGLRVVVLLHHIGDDGVDDIVHIVAVDLAVCGSLGSRLLRDVVRGVGVNDVLIEGSLILFLRDGIFIEHVVETEGTSFLVGVRIEQRVICGRCLGDTGKAGIFRNGQLVEVLAEVLLGSGLDAVTAGAQGDGVEVRFEDLFLTVVVLEVQSVQDLLEFSGDGDLVLFRQVLDELLCQRGTALTAVVFDDSTDGTDPVDTVVFVESLVLKTDERLLEPFRDLVEFRPDTVLFPVKSGDLRILALRILCIDDTGLCLLGLVVVEVDGGTAMYVCDDIDKHEDHRQQDPE